MLTEYEARKFQEDMRQELNASSGVVSKCTLMLLVILVLAWFGHKGETEHDSMHQSAENAFKKERASRTVFEQRRQRYGDAAQHPRSFAERPQEGRAEPVARQVVTVD